MLGILTSNIKCEVCGDSLVLDQPATIESYSAFVNTDVSDIFDKIDNIIGKYLIYTCISCGQQHRYTYRDLEYRLRKDLTEQYLMLSVRGSIEETPSLTDKYFIYCGKCNGFDGNGGCPKTIFNKCEIKRFPIDEL